MTEERKKLKVAYYSDLHLEFGRMDLPTVEADVVILAGDINVKARVDWINDLANVYEHVIYVLGNHCYWDGHIEHTIKKLRATLYENVHLLQNEYIKINGVKFHGCTFWTDLNAHGNQPMSILDANQGMNDFRKIKKRSQYPSGEVNEYGKFRAEDSVYENSKSKAYLTNNVEEGDVIITHHAPHQNSSHEYFKGSRLNPCYYSDMTAFMMHNKPSHWIHGHMHNSSDYMIDQTRVLCNPRGYDPFELNPDFDIDATFEI